MGFERATPARAATTLLLALVSVAGWQTPARAVECSQIQFQDARSTVCRVDLRKDHLQLFLNDATGKPFNTFRRLAEGLSNTHQRLVFAMNAGMFRQDYSAVGLLVINGQKIHRINLANATGNFYLKPNGVFLITGHSASIVESSEYAALETPVMLATQSGPLMLRKGEINSNLNPQGTSRLIRNGVGVVTANEVVFAISEDPVTFYEFTLLFRDRLQCQDALYLDGNVSSLYAQALGRADASVPLGPMVGVTVPESP